MANPYTRIGYSGSDGTDGSTTLPPNVSYGTKSTGKTKRRNPYTSYGYTDENPTSFADQLQETIATSKPTPANTDSNLQKIGHVGAGVGRFIKNVAKDVKDTTVETYQGLGDVARGELGRQGVERTTKIIEQRNKQWREQFGSANDSQWQDPAFQAKAKEFSAGTKALINSTNKYNERSNADIATQQKVDTKKLAFQAGETALNVGTLGVGGLVTAPIKAGLKLGARKVAKDVTQSLSKKILTTAGKDSALGVGYGITQTGKNNPDATAGEYVKGGVIGGVAGGVLGATIPASGALLKTRPAQKVDAFLSDLGQKSTAKVANTAVGKKVGNIKEKVAITFGEYLAPVMRDFKGLKDSSGRQINEEVRRLDTNVANFDSIGIGRLKENKAFGKIADILQPDKTIPGSLRANRKEKKELGEFISQKQQAINNQKLGKGGEIPVGTPRQEQVYKLLNQATKDDVKYAYENNLITKVQHDKWIKDENYTRVQKQMDDHVQSQYKGVGGPNASISKPGALSQRLKGGGGESIDPFVAYVDWSKKITHDVQRAKLSNYIIDKRVEHGLGKGYLRTADTVEKRIQSYAEAKQLRILRSGLEKAVKSESRYGKQLEQELNQLNIKGKDLSIKNAGSSKQPGARSGTKAHIDSLIKTSTSDLNRIKQKIAKRNPKMAAHIDNIISLKYQHEIAAKEVKELVSIARANGDKTATGKATIKTLKRGIKEVYEDDPRIVDAINKVGRVELHAMLRYAQAPSKLVQRTAVAWNFAFTGKNFARDQVSSFILSKNALATHNPISFMAGLKEATLKPTGKAVLRAVGARKTAAKVLNPTDEYLNFLKYVAGSTRTDISRNLKKSSRATDELLGLKNESLIRKVENVNSATENVTRYQNYWGTLKSDLKKGVDSETAHKNAIQAARENSVDFMRQGDAAPFLKIFQPFANANIQGSRSLVRALKERPIGTSMKIATTILTPVAAATYYNLSDPNRAKVYDALSPNDKANNLIFITGNGSVFKIPLAPGVRDLAGPVRQMIEFEHGYGNRPGFMETAKALVGTVNPSSGVGDLVPQAFKPAIEAKTNYNFFKADNIVPEYLKDKDPKDQVFKGTGQTYRDIGDKFGISPLKARNIIVGYTSSVGEQSVSLFDQLRGAKNNKVVTENRNTAQQIQGAFYEPKPDLEQRIKREWYNSYNTLSTRQRNVSNEVTKLVIDGKRNEAARKAQEFNQSIQPGFTDYYTKYGKNPGQEQFWNDMVNSLPITVTPEAFDNREKQYKKSHTMVR